MFNNSWGRAKSLMGHSSSLTLQIKMSPLAKKKKVKGKFMSIIISPVLFHPFTENLLKFYYGLGSMPVMVSYYFH